jgi:glycosyltransferase involved in cell wall biosynthesis
MFNKCIITISQFTKKRIIEKFHISPHNLFVIPCGLTQSFINFSYDENQINRTVAKHHLENDYLLCLSTLEPRKNLRLLVDAYKELIVDNKIDLDLVLAGRKGWKIDNLLAEIPDDVLNRIHITGFIDEDDLPSIYSKAKIFVFPSLYEGFGIPPLEAMSVGTQVVSSDAGSLPEILKDKAFFFQSNDIVSLKMQMLFALKSPIFQSSQNNSRHLIEYTHKFQWSNSALDLMKHLITKSQQ